jgi:hypothetical protein
VIHVDAIDRLNRLTTLMDRARESVRADLGELTSLLDEASLLLDTMGAELRDAAGGTTPDQTLLAAAVRARASHAALHRMLREQLATLGQQVVRADASADAAARYAVPRAAGQRLDRLG